LTPSLFASSISAPAKIKAIRTEGLVLSIDNASGEISFDFRFGLASL